MKRLVASAVVTVLLLPAALSALSIEEAREQILFTLGRLAFLEAEAAGERLACALIASKAEVAIGEPFDLMWSTYGALSPESDGESRWTQNGIATVALPTSGRFEYGMTFQGQGGEERTCTVRVTVRA